MLAKAYHQAFSSYSWYIAPPLKDAKRISSFHLFSMRIKGFNRKMRDELMAHLKEYGVASNVHFMPLPLLSLHRNRGENISNYPNSAKAFEELISLPLHLNLSVEDIYYIRDVSAGFIENALKHG
jgi:dTDP-4-amino-4,6-dideoxygalactose transaminase